MKVGDILRKKTARIATVRMNETVGIAAQLMRASNISALVVKDVVRTEGNTAVGMFTERDVVRAIAEHGAAGGRYSNEAVAALTRDYPDVFLPGWAMVDPWRGGGGRWAGLLFDPRRA